MSSPAGSIGAYSLAIGEAAVRRLKALHHIYGPAGRRVLSQAGLTPGMDVVDFGCGVGVISRMLADMVGPTGSVTGIDVSAAQLDQARAQFADLPNVTFIEASAVSTGLPRDSADLVYCRFLLLHLVDPAACLSEMRGVLRSGGLLVVEDGDLTAAGSMPPARSARSRICLRALAHRVASTTRCRATSITWCRPLDSQWWTSRFTSLRSRAAKPASS